jgi:hypothetical protein
MMDGSSPACLFAISIFPCASRISGLSKSKNNQRHSVRNGANLTAFAADFRGQLLSDRSVRIEHWGPRELVRICQFLHFEFEMTLDDRSCRLR